VVNAVKARVGLLALALALADGVAARAADPSALLEPMAAAYARVERYTARFIRQEVVDGRLRPREEVLLKFQRPGLLYLRWVSGPPAGREILFVPGQHENRMLVSEPGLLTSLVTIALAPDSPRVFEESRHAVTDIGVGRLVELILDNTRRAAAAGELHVRDLGAVTGPERPGRRIEVVLPRRPERGYYCHRLDLLVATGSGLPLRAIIHDWHDRMVADYAYLDLTVNPALAPIDFDAANPAYKFRSWKIVR
jgi:Protein of unknown function (DUF1571)